MILKNSTKVFYKAKILKFQGILAKIICYIVIFSCMHVFGGTWTFMVYLAADNDLEKAAIEDFLEMATVGSTAYMNIVVQFDRAPGYDTRYENWTGTLRFYVIEGMEPLPEKAIVDIDEANMADKKTLVDFVKWTVKNYPAQHYILVLWSHGDGWKKYKKSTKAICVDESSLGDWLYTRELVEALRELSLEGIKIDVIGFDACLMGMVEVAYALRELCDIMIASEEIVPARGWPYDIILSKLKEYPQTDPNSFSQIIVNEYIDQFVGTHSYTMSVIDLDKVGVLTPAVSNLAHELLKNTSYRPKIEDARNRVKNFYFSGSEYIDLVDFAQVIHSTFTDNSTISQAALSVQFHTKSAVIEHAYGEEASRSCGLSIYFPTKKGYYESEYSFSFFAQDTLWDELLLWYYELHEDKPKDREKIIVYPNPCIVSKHARKVYFKHIPLGATISIYTCAGELIHQDNSQTDSYTWHFSNEVASGIYIYIIKDRNTRITGKLAIIR